MEALGEALGLGVRVRALMLGLGVREGARPVGVEACVGVRGGVRVALGQREREGLPLAVGEREGEGGGVALAPAGGVALARGATIDEARARAKECASRVLPRA